jgi:hypothetical protein
VSGEGAGLYYNNDDDDGGRNHGNHGIDDDDDDDPAIGCAKGSGDDELQDLERQRRHDHRLGQEGKQQQQQPPLSSPEAALSGLSGLEEKSSSATTQPLPPRSRSALRREFIDHHKGRNWEIPGLRRRRGGRRHGGGAGFGSGSSDASSGGDDDDDDDDGEEVDGEEEVDDASLGFGTRHTLRASEQASFLFLLLVLFHCFLRSLLFTFIVGKGAEIPFFFFFLRARATLPPLKPQT